MFSAARAPLKPLECCVGSLSNAPFFRATRPHCLSLSPPSRPTKLSCSPWLSLKPKISLLKLIPLFAQTSDLVGQEQEEEKQQFVDGVSLEDELAEEDSFGSPEREAEGEQEEEENVNEVGVIMEKNEEEAESEEYFPESPEEYKLFVGNLPYEIDSEKLARVFSQAGTVEIAEVIYNRETERSRGFGFVTMSTVEEAEKAVEMFNRYDLNGRPLAVNKASPRGSRPPRSPRVFEPAYRIYVTNLPWQVDGARLEQLFSEHGKVVEAKVIYERETGRSRGFGFVTMSTESELNDAIAALDGQNMDGRAIRVSVAEGKRRRSSDLF